MRMPTALFFPLITILLIGCAGIPVGPGDPAARQSAILAAIKQPQERILFNHRANWINGTRGLAGVNIMVGMPTILSGILVCTDQNVTMLVWDSIAKRYVQHFSVQYSKISDIEMLKYGRSRQLVIGIVEQAGTAWHTFEITGEAGAMVDQEASAQAFETIKAQRDAAIKPR